VQDRHETAADAAIPHSPQRRQPDSRRRRRRTDDRDLPFVVIRQQPFQLRQGGRRDHATPVKYIPETGPLRFIHMGLFRERDACPVKARDPLQKLRVVEPHERTEHGRAVPPRPSQPPASHVGAELVDALDQPA
jgi:hypothetical protein